PQRFLGDAKRGTIAPGMRADLVLLDGNPLENIRNASRVSGVLSGGTWRDGGQIREILGEVERSARDAG
ncbi:MAG TPA: amidohydrolase, partial [Candidatus Eisenbacteria bacterium]|nr:amidohydrolase [Candidatus Eisenbacteria bacterium]